MRDGCEMDVVIMRRAASLGCAENVGLGCQGILVSSIGASVGLTLTLVSCLALIEGLLFFEMNTGKAKSTEASIEEARIMHNIETKISTHLDRRHYAKGPGQPPLRLRLSMSRSLATDTRPWFCTQTSQLIVPEHDLTLLRL